MRYCALNNFVSCGNDVTWPSGGIMNNSIVVPTKVLMNSLHRAASEPLTSIICVWKAARWASRSSIPVKVTLGPRAWLVSLPPQSLSRMALGILWVVSQAPDLHPHAQPCGFAGFCTAPHSRLGTLPNQLGCVLGLLLTWPLPPERLASSP